MKKPAGLLAVLALLLLQVGGAFAQSSDYETIDSYKKRHQSLLKSIKSAQDLGQRDMLESEIGRLEARLRAAPDAARGRPLPGELRSLDRRAARTAGQNRPNGSSWSRRAEDKVTIEDITVTEIAEEDRQYRRTKSTGLRSRS